MSKCSVSSHTLCRGKILVQLLRRSDLVHKATASIFLARVTAKAKALFAEGGMLLCSLRLARLGYGVVEAKG